MINFDAISKEKILEMLAAPDRQGKVLRIQIVGLGPDGFSYSLRFVDPAEGNDEDVRLDGDGFDVLIDPETAGKIEGATVEFVENEYQTGFHVENPNPIYSDPLEQSVFAVLRDQINPGVAAHGGFVTLLEVRDQVAYVELGGGCQECSLADVTLKQGIDVMIREEVPEIQAVIDTTNHAAGTNPFYQPAKGGAPAPGQSALS